MHMLKLMLALVMAPGLAACATVATTVAAPEAMAVDAGATGNSLPKYRNAVAVRSVSGGRENSILTAPGVSDEPFKAALESSLEAKGYLAKSGTPKFYVDAQIQNLDAPLMGLTMDVTASVTYKVSGAGGGGTYPISSTANATMSDSMIGVDRVRIANERAMQQNIRMFLSALK